MTAGHASCRDDCGWCCDAPASLAQHVQNRKGSHHPGCWQLIFLHNRDTLSLVANCKACNCHDDCSWCIDAGTTFSYTFFALCLYLYIWHGSLDSWWRSPWEQTAIEWARVHYCSKQQQEWKNCSGCSSIWEWLKLKYNVNNSRNVFFEIKKSIKYSYIGPIFAYNTYSILILLS